MCDEDEKYKDMWKSKKHLVVRCFFDCREIKIFIHYFANATARVSRMTVIFTCPG